MVKKKVSGQTIAIIILGILLLLTIIFGSVFAFYSARTNRVTGKIIMANLNISLYSDSGSSDKSEIVISNGTNVLPNQQLENSPLLVKNTSSVPIYLILVYKVQASTEDGEVIDDYKGSKIDMDYDYYNPSYPEYTSGSGDYSHQKSTEWRDTVWVDYVFSASNLSGDPVVYRCLVSTVPYAVTAEGEEGITVIGENKLRLSGQMGNEFQRANISFTFQAYAIGRDSLLGSITNEEKFTESASSKEKCEKIVNAIFRSQQCEFLRINVNP